MAEVLVIGNGAREHALGWKIAQSPEVSKVYFAKGNAGTALIGENVDISPTDIRGLREFARIHNVDLTVPGLDRTVYYGIADAFAQYGLPIFAPSGDGAKLEGSKIKQYQKLKEWRVPQPNAWVFSWEEINKAYYFIVNNDPLTYVIKADGLAEGKGVFLPVDLEDAKRILSRLMFEEKLGPAGANILVQERLTGREASIHLISDGETYHLMPVFRDHKQLNGNMTGGMGGYGPVEDVSDNLIGKIETDIVKPILGGLKKDGTPYKGALYPGLMITEEGPKVLEINCRFGDPEAELLMMLLKSDLYKHLRACALGELDKEEIEYYEGAALCVVLASRNYGDQDSYIRTDIPIKGLSGITSEDLQIFHGGTKMKDGQLVTDGGRVLTITARRDSLQEARDAVYGVIGEKGVNFWEMQYRRDI